MLSVLRGGLTLVTTGSKDVNAYSIESRRLVSTKTSNSACVADDLHLCTKVEFCTFYGFAFYDQGSKEHTLTFIIAYFYYFIITHDRKYHNVI